VPVFHELHLQIGDRRSLDPGVIVADRVVVSRELGVILVRDVDSAGEADPSVDNGDLAVFVGLIQGTPSDFLQGYEIAPYSTWFTVQSGGSGTVDPGDSTDIEFLVDFRDSTIVPDSTYQGVATVNTNDPYPPEWNPQILFSITAGAGGCDYAVGDVNGSGTYNGLDVTYGVNWFKYNVDPPLCPDCPPCNSWYYCGDVNASCSYNGLDITYSVNYFKYGIDPPEYCVDCPPTGGAPAVTIEDQELKPTVQPAVESKSKKESDLKR